MENYSSDINKEYLLTISFHKLRKKYVKRQDPLDQELQEKDGNNENLKKKKKY